MWYTLLVLGLITAFLAGVGIGFCLGALYFEGEGRND